MNRRLVVAALGLALVIWAVALVRTTPRVSLRQTRPVLRGPSAVPQAKAAPVLPSSPAPVARASEAQPTAAAQSKTGTIAPDDPYRKKLAGLVAEQRRLSAERFARADERWPHQRRTEPWATQHEKQLRAAMEADQIDVLIDALECRETLCRLELAAQDSNAAVAFNGARALHRQIGKQTSAAMTGGGLDRRMILYVPREGQPLEP
jgi:hypothetical protein